MYFFMHLYVLLIYLKKGGGGGSLACNLHVLLCSSANHCIMEQYLKLLINILFLIEIDEK